MNANNGLQDYRAILRDKLEQKTKRNSAFSLRAFAKKSGVSHAMLSQVLGGSKNLSRESATRVAEHLEFEENEREIFVSLVEYATTRSRTYKDLLHKKIARLSPQNESLTLTLEMFKCISEWYHLAILELTRLDGFRPSAKFIAGKLGITELEASGALDRLIRLGLLVREDGTFRKSAPIIETTTDVPSASIREHHRQMIAKAVDALESQSIDQRYVTDMTIAIDAAKIPEAKKRIERFKAELSEFLNLDTPRKNSVYQLNLQFFDLTRNKGVPK